MDIKTKYKIGDEIFFLTEDDGYHSVSKGKIHLIKGIIKSLRTYR